MQGTSAQKTQRKADIGNDKKKASCRFSRAVAYGPASTEETKDTKPPVAQA